jgi:hypothetical protein
MRSRVRFPVLPWGFFLEGKDSHGHHGLGSFVELRFKTPPLIHIHISPSTSSGKSNCASWASQPENSVTPRPQTGREPTKSKGDVWWPWHKKIFKEPVFIHTRILRSRCLRSRYAAARLLRLRFRIQSGHGCLSVVMVVCCLYDGLITRPEESYRM